jgi:uncharacterized membrane protein YkoI
MVDRKKLVASAAAAAVLTLGAGTAVIAQQDGLPGKQDEPAITGTLTAPQENEAEGSENEASEGQDPDESLTGSPARRAADAALRAAGGGDVLEVEQGDDPNAAYEAEIRKPDGSIVEVMLDGNFNVISQATGD